jgi:hypothetical protein
MFLQRGLGGGWGEGGGREFTAVYCGGGETAECGGIARAEELRERDAWREGARTDAMQIIQAAEKQAQGLLPDTVPVTFRYEPADLALVQHEDMLPLEPVGFKAHQVPPGARFRTLTPLPLGLEIDPGSGIIFGTPDRVTSSLVSGLPDMQTWTIVLAREAPPPADWSTPLSGAPSSRPVSARSVWSVADSPYSSSSPRSQAPLFTPRNCTARTTNSVGHSTQNSFATTPSTVAFSRPSSSRSLGKRAQEKQPQILASATVTIVVQARPGKLEYTFPVAIYPLEPGLEREDNRREARAEMQENKVKSVVGSSLEFSVAPALPDGLVLDAHTGAISGTPLSEYPRTILCVTARNRVGTTHVHIVVEVQKEPALLSYQTCHMLCTRGVPVAANRPQPALVHPWDRRGRLDDCEGTGGEEEKGSRGVVNLQAGGEDFGELRRGTESELDYSVEPPLPCGLVLNDCTGVVCGTPMETTYQQVLFLWQSDIPSGDLASPDSPPFPPSLRPSARGSAKPSPLAMSMAPGEPTPRNSNNSLIADFSAALRCARAGVTFSRALELTAEGACHGASATTEGEADGRIDARVGSVAVTDGSKTPRTPRSALKSRLVPRTGSGEWGAATGLQVTHDEFTWVLPAGANSAASSVSVYSGVEHAPLARKQGLGLALEDPLWEGALELHPGAGGIRLQSSSLESAKIEHRIVYSNDVGASESALSIAVLECPDLALAPPEPSDTQSSTPGSSAKKTKALQVKRTPSISRLPSVDLDPRVHGVGAGRMRLSEESVTLRLGQIMNPIVVLAADGSCIGENENGGTILRFSVSPPLPNGICLDSRTGMIFGRPIQVQSRMYVLLVDRFFSEL